MSTTDPAPALAPDGLFTALIDDAAVFPPGLAPVDVAVREHLALRTGPYAALLGPLLIPVSGVAALTDTLAKQRPSPDLAVVLIARPGRTVGQIEPALDALRPVSGVSVVGVELAHQPGWQGALAWRLPLAVEVGREPVAQQAALAELAVEADRGGAVRAKLRTQSTAVEPVPTAAELAGFLAAARAAGIGVKLTGGLHHAIAHTTSLPENGPHGRHEDQHGVLNILLATHLLDHGADQPEVVRALTERDPAALTEPLTALTDDQVRQLRSRFTAYGCCGVLDPVTDLIALGLLDLPAPDQPEETRL